MKPKEIYDILVQYCGAANDFKSQQDFITASNDCFHSTKVFEYRFQASLGFGGKIWLNTGNYPHVTCYREDRTPTRYRSMLAANKALKELLNSHTIKNQRK